MADGAVTVTPEGKVEVPREPLKISEAGYDELMRALAGSGNHPFVPETYVPAMPREDIFRAARPPKPKSGAMPMAFDTADKLAQDWDTNNLSFALMGGELLSQGIGFLGYPFLAELTQRPEYRKISEIIAEEMTRKWIRITSKGDDDKTERIQELEEALKKFKLRQHFRQSAELDGEMGRVQLFIDVGKGVRDDGEELKKPLMLDPAKIAKGSLEGFRVVEPMWSYPLQYNATSPLRPDFYVPKSWAVMHHEVHTSRLLTFVGRPMPDILKPAYAFGGLSLSQMAMPYVQNWLRTRQSVSDLIHSFSVMILATNMGQTLDATGMANLLKRVTMAVQMRDNRGLQIINKDTEEFNNVAAPLGGLHELQAQSQEQQSAVASIPLVKLLGITPSGLNASSDGEIRVFYDRVMASQETLFGDPLTHAIKVIMLHLWGEVDDDIGYEWVPLWQLDSAGQASVWKSNVDSDVELINAGVLDPAESRKRIAGEMGSPYASLDVDDVPDDPRELDRESEEAEASLPNPAKSLGESPKTARAGDAAFVESEHPRDPEGKFSQGGGGGGAAPSGGGGERPPFSSEETRHLPKVAHQPVSSWKEAQARGEVARSQLMSKLGRVAESLGLKTDVERPEDLTDEHVSNPHGYLFVAPNKSEARAKAKVESEYQGDWTKLRDMVRASIAVTSVAELRKAIAAVEAQGLKLAQAPKDKFSNPTPEGYRDLNTVVRLPNGMVAELQYHIKPIVRAKQAAHGHYEEMQHLARKNGSEEPNPMWEPREAEAFKRARAAHRAIYDPIWEKAAAG